MSVTGIVSRLAATQSGARQGSLSLAFAFCAVVENATGALGGGRIRPTADDRPPGCLRFAGAFRFENADRGVEGFGGQLLFVRSPGSGGFHAFDLRLGLWLRFRLDRTRNRRTVGLKH